MPDLKISELNATTNPTVTSFIPVVDNNTVTQTLTNFRTNIGLAGGVRTDVGTNNIWSINSSFTNTGSGNLVLGTARPGAALSGVVTLGNNIAPTQNEQINISTRHAVFQTVSGRYNSAGGMKQNLFINFADSVATLQGSMNTALTGVDNFAIGTRAGFSLTRGSYNILIGGCAGEIMSTGCNNIFLGNIAGRNYSDGLCNNIIIGNSAGFLLGGPNRCSNRDNIIIGHAAAKNFAGNRNVFIGGLAGQYGHQDSTACDNVGIGYGTLRLVNRGQGNVSVGSGQMGNLSGGCFTVSIGTVNGSFVGSGLGACDNVFIGRQNGVNGIGGQCGLAAGGSCGNVIIGAYNAYSAKYSRGNILIGINNMFNNTGGIGAGLSGSNNILIGRSNSTQGSGNAFLSNTIVLGSNATASASNTFVLGSATTPISTVPGSTIAGQVSSLIINLNGQHLRIPVGFI